MKPMVILVGLSLTAVSAGSEPTARPVGVSPGGSARFRPTADACPTFSWSAVD